MQKSSVLQQVEGQLKSGLEAYVAQFGEAPCPDVIRAAILAILEEQKQFFWRSRFRGSNPQRLLSFLEVLTEINEQKKKPVVQSDSVPEKPTKPARTTRGSGKNKKALPRKSSTSKGKR